MKIYTIILFLLLVPYFGLGQSNTSSENIFGLSLNSSLNSEIIPIRLIPSVHYTKGKTQIELGIGFQPFNLKDERVLSTEVNYKFFADGLGNKFNLYFLISITYVHQLQKTYFPTTNQYVFAHGGYGFQMRLHKRTYLGTNIQIGGFGKSIHSTNPIHNQFASEDLFEEFGLNLAFQLNVGYRF